MGTTAQKLTYTANAINGIKSALEERGIVVGDTPLGDYASLIESISTDGTTSLAEKSLTEVTERMIESITQIGDYAFYNQANLTTIEIPSTVTSIGDYAFYGCVSLTTIHFWGTSAQWASVTKGSNWDGNTGEYSVVCGSVGLSFVSNGDGTCKVNGIGTCTDTDLVIPDVSPVGDAVTNIGERAFRNCSGLTSVKIPDSVTNIGISAFSGCSGLTSVTIGNSVTSIGKSAFYDCSRLTSITIPNSVTYIGFEAFYNCTWLTSVTIPDSVTSIGDKAFYNCSRLTSITIPDGVTSIGDYVFYNCSGLTSVTIQDGVRSIGYGAFLNCSGLHEITIPNSVTYIGRYTFDGCTGLTSITVVASAPPDLEVDNLDAPDAFNNTNNCPIYVPAASVSAYKNNYVWVFYASRIQAIQS